MNTNKLSEKNKGNAVLPLVSGSYGFDTEKLDEAIKKAINTEIVYCIGINTYDKDNYTYCLSRTIDKKFEIILLKRKKDRKEFDEEVENMAKYFNAKVVSG